MPQEPTDIEWDDAKFEAALKRVAGEGVVDAPGVRLSSGRLRELLDAAPEDPERPGRRQLDRADFRGATFDGDAYFRWAIFRGDADFSEATFDGIADFGGATFSGDAYFVGATFGGGAAFGRATFRGLADIRWATFRGSADFGRATFRGAAYFDEATFRGPAFFDEATFGEDADFVRATFGGPADFGEATVDEDANFREATFEQARELGPVLVFGGLFLDRSVVSQAIRIEVSARRTSCNRAVFEAGADVFVRWAEVSLEDTDFAEPSLVAELPATRGPEGRPRYLGLEEPLDDGGWACPLCWEEQVDGGGWVVRRAGPGPGGPAWRCRPGDPPERFEPRLVSLRRAKVAQLTLSGVDLRACRFVGAHGLDRLRLERARFAQPPGWRARLRRVRWTRRQTVAEEHLWRLEHGHGSGWEQDYVRAAGWLEQASEPPHPEQIAGIYRALRKGREDNKDEPGAGDFYYGEMEMRRHAKSSGGGGGQLARAGSRAERLLLTLYWAVSGYGLRASRALAALVLAVSLFTAGFHLYGFRDPVRPYAARTELQPAPTKPFPPSPADIVDAWGSLEAWTYSAGTGTAIIGAPDAQLTQYGRGMRIALRILGPLLIGLALLAIRGRVKR